VNLLSEIVGDKLGSPTTAGGLEGLIRQQSVQPPRIVLYGLPGVGKTTFAASADAVLIDCEGGAGALPGLTRTPTLSTWPEIKSWIDRIEKSNDGHPVAIDTLDWMIRRIVEYVTIELDGKAPNVVTNTIGSSHGGYYKARDIVLNIVYRELLPALNRIVDSGRPIIILAHAIHQKLTTPEGFDIATATPDLGEWILPVWVEWADCVLYAHIDGAKRMARTSATNLIMAKNRYSLPETIDLHFKALTYYLNNGNGKDTNNG